MPRRIGHNACNWDEFKTNEHRQWAKSIFFSVGSVPNLEVLRVLCMALYDWLKWFDEPEISDAWRSSIDPCLWHKLNCRKLEIISLQISNWTNREICKRVFHPIYCRFWLWTERASVKSSNYNMHIKALNSEWEKREKCFWITSSNKNNHNPFNGAAACKTQSM